MGGFYAEALVTQGIQTVYVIFGGIFPVPQIVTLINSGEITDSHLSQRYMEQLKEYIDRSVKAIGALVEKNRKRGL